MIMGVAWRPTWLAAGTATCATVVAAALVCRGRSSVKYVISRIEDPDPRLAALEEAI
jgi:hypothetical protein